MKMIKQGFSPDRDTRIGYLIVTILLFISGNPALMGETRMEVSIVLTSGVFFVILMCKRDMVLTSRFAVVFLVLVVILVEQCLTFGFWPYHTMLGFLLRLFIGYAAVRLVRDFPRKYVQVMFYTCLISWPFHLIAILHATTGIDLIKFFAPLDKIANPYRGFHIIVHNFGYYVRVPEQLQNFRFAYLYPLRNSSHFWEPGVFAAYILLAIAFLGLTKEKFNKQLYSTIFVILVITLLTTMSTTGYILLPLCLLFHLREMHGIRLTAKQVPKILGLALIFAFFCIVASKLDFVGTKIAEQVDKISYRDVAWERTRFGALFHDFEYIKQRPFLGWGLNSKTRHMFYGGVNPKAMGNGLADFTVKFGLFGLITVLICIWAGIYQLTNHNRMLSSLFVLFVVMVLNGEHLLDYSLFLGLMFLEPMSKKRHSILEFENSAITEYE